MSKILLVEDDIQLCKLIHHSLENAHYQVESANEGREALDRVLVYSYDLIVMDWELPKATGVDICREFRAQGGTTPILMLTGKNSIVEKETGFRSGVDDYLTKPFDMTELLLRVAALLRRPAALLPDELTVGDLKLNPRKFHATKAGKSLKLTALEFSLLEFFMRHEGQVFSAEAIIDRVWQDQSDSTADSLRVMVGRLRKKIDSSGAETLIENVYGMGYMFKRAGD